MIDILLISKLAKSISCELNVDYFQVERWMRGYTELKRIDDFYAATQLPKHHALVDAAALCEAYSSDIEVLIDVKFKR